MRVGDSLVAIIGALRRRIAEGESVIPLHVPDPARGRGHYAGEVVDGRVHRPLRVWVELADRLELRLAAARPLGDGTLELRFERLADATPPPNADMTEKYGTHSEFARISKLEDPGFVIDVEDAIARADLGPKPAVLDLGCNQGDVLELLLLHRPGATIVGVDHSASAVDTAAQRFPTQRFIEADLARVPDLELARFDLVLALSTLQSPGVDDRELLRHIVQDRLQPGGALIIGIPNCRYRDGELLHGARMRNFSQPDLSLVVKNAAFFRRYLQQHKKRVFITGRNYILVTAVRR